MPKAFQTLALALCCFFLITGSAYGFRSKRSTQSTATSTPIYTYPNGTVVPQDELAQLLANPNTQVVNNTAPSTESAETTQPAATATETETTPQPAATDASTQSAAPTQSSQPVYTYPNGTVVPADQLAALLNNPNTTVVNKTNNATEEQPESTPVQQNQTAPVQTEAPETTPVQIQAAPVTTTTAPAGVTTTAPVGTTSTPVTSVPVTSSIAPTAVESVSPFATFGGSPFQMFGGSPFGMFNSPMISYGGYPNTYGIGSYGAVPFGGLSTSFGNGFSFGSTFGSPYGYSTVISIPEMSYGYNYPTSNLGGWAF